MRASIEFIPNKLTIKSELFEDAERLNGPTDIEFDEYIRLSNIDQTFVEEGSAPNHRALFLEYMQPTEHELKIILRLGNKLIFRYICAFDYDETQLLRNIDDFKYASNVEIFSIALDTPSDD